jgi:hypothetical protein
MGEAQQYRKELMRNVPKIIERRKVNTFHNNDVWTADIVDYSNIAKSNKSIKYLLFILDVYSRYAFIFTLKDKTSKTVLDKFKTLKTYPKLLWVDRGGEFTNNEFKDFCKSKGMKIYHTYGESKAVFIERLNRTIKRKLQNKMLEENTNKYIDVLFDVVENYNDTIHSSTGETPTDIYINGKSSNDIPIDIIDKKPKYSVGDYVRISRTKGVFEKGYAPKWSKEVFRITKVDKLYPVMYQLEDQLKEPIEGKFYETELQKTNLKDYAMIEKVIRTKKVNGVKKYYVKYDGYDDKFNEWIDEDRLDKRT